MTYTTNHNGDGWAFVLASDGRGLLYIPPDCNFTGPDANTHARKAAERLQAAQAATQGARP